jgi:hypothetical protein
MHIGWSPVDAKLIDQRMLRRTTDSSQAATSQVWEYLVEIAGTDGTAVRLTIKEETFKLKLPGVGGRVPVLVNKKRTKAVFNLKDPRIDAVGALKAKEAATKAADKERFDAELHHDGPPHDQR